MGPTFDPTNGNPYLKKLLAEGKFPGMAPPPPTAPPAIVDASKPRPITVQPMTPPPELRTSAKLPEPPSSLPSSTADTNAVPAPPYERGTLGGEKAEENRIAATGSGIHQIKNPFLHGLAATADVLGQTFLPRLEMAIPGTEGHHQMLLGQQRGRIKDLETEQNEEARRTQEAAQTHNLESEARERERPKYGAPVATEGGLVTQRQGSPEGEPFMVGGEQAQPREKEFAEKQPELKQDEEGHYWRISPDGLATPVMVNGQHLKGLGKEKTIPLENQIVSEHLEKVHPGETLADARLHTQPKQPGVTVNAGAARADRSYDKRNAELTAIGKPITDLSARFGRLQDTLAQGSPQADALIAPELLTVMAGGAGSGLRMNEAEIARIVGGRSKWQNLKAAVQQWSLDPSKANSITPEQRQQIRELASIVGGKLLEKQKILNDAYSGLAGTDDEKEHRRIVNDVRSRFMKIDQGEESAKAAGTLHYVEGSDTYDIPPDKEKRFLELHPQARRQ